MAIQALAVVNDSPIAQRDLDTYRKHYAPQSSPEEWELFIETCQAYGLSPMRKQIYLVSRPTWNARERREEWKATPQVSIEGLRDIAARTGKYQGRVGPFWKAKNGEWTDCWNIDNGTHPYAAKVGVWKEGFKEPLFAVVYFHEMAQYAGKGENRRLNNFWDKFGIIMLAKCGEAASIRAAFPETSGLYIHEEMRQANAEAAYIRVTPEADDQDAQAIIGEVVQAIASPNTTKDDSTSSQDEQHTPVAPSVVDKVRAKFVEVWQVAEQDIETRWKNFKRHVLQAVVDDADLSDAQIGKLNGYIVAEQKKMSKAS